MAGRVRATGFLLILTGFAVGMVGAWDAPMNGAVLAALWFVCIGIVLVWLAGVVA